MLWLSGRMQPPWLGILTMVLLINRGDRWLSPAAGFDSQKATPFPEMRVPGPCFWMTASCLEAECGVYHHWFCLGIHWRTCKIWFKFMSVLNMYRYPWSLGMPVIPQMHVINWQFRPLVQIGNHEINYDHQLWFIAVHWNPSLKYQTANHQSLPSPIVIMVQYVMIQTIWVKLVPLT